VAGLVGAAATSSVAITRSWAEAATRLAADAATDEVAAAVATTAVATAAAVSQKVGAVSTILFGDEKNSSEEEASTSSFEPSGESGDGKSLYHFINLLFYLCLSFNPFL
jgi:hypothetical protein